MIVVVIMLVARVFVVAIFANNEQYLLGFELALNEFICFLRTENLLKTYSYEDRRKNKYGCSCSGCLSPLCGAP